MASARSSNTADSLQQVYGPQNQINSFQQIKTALLALVEEDTDGSRATAESIATLLLERTDLPFLLLARCHIVLGNSVVGAFLWHAQEAVRLLEAVRLPDYEERVLLEEARETLAEAEQEFVKQNAPDAGEDADDEGDMDVDYDSDEDGGDDAGLTWITEEEMNSGNFGLNISGGAARF